MMATHIDDLLWSKSEKAERVFARMTLISGAEFSQGENTFEIRATCKRTTDRLCPIRIDRSRERASARERGHGE